MVWKWNWSWNEVLELEVDRGLGFDRESGCRSLVCVCVNCWSGELVALDLELELEGGLVSEGERVFFFFVFFFFVFFIIVVFFFVFVIRVRGSVIGMGIIINGLGMGFIGLGIVCSIGNIFFVFFIFFIVDLVMESSAVLGRAFSGYLILAKRPGAHWEGSHVRVSGFR